MSAARLQASPQAFQRPHKPGDIVVIGAGPAGLAAGLALGERGVVLDSRAGPGGLCQTIEFEGTVFDLGGHSFHTPHGAIRDLVFAAVPMEEQPRRAQCHVAGEWVPYPFQRYFTAMANRTIREACQAGLATADACAGAADFADYLDRRFGAAIAHHFMRPYNRKLWGGDLSRLAVDWAPERIAAANGEAVQATGVDLGRRPLEGDTIVAYPAEGGFGAIYSALARRLPRLRFGQSVVSIDPQRRELTTSRGDRVLWSELISTLPLPRLLELLPDVPRPLAKEVSRLEALPVTLVMLALRRRIQTSIQRIYCPDPAFIGHKIVLNHNSSAYLRSLPRHGIQIEISGRHPDSAALTALVIANLRRLGLVKDTDDLAASRIVELPFGYPVPTHERSRIVKAAAGWLAARGIWTVGRFGEWAYINSDEALHRGLRLGQALACGATPAMGRCPGG